MIAMVLRVTLFSLVSFFSSAAATQALTPQHEFVDQVNAHFERLLAPKEFAECKPLIESTLAWFMQARKENLAALLADGSVLDEHGFYGNELALLSLLKAHLAGLAHHFKRQRLRIKYRFGWLELTEHEGNELLITDFTLALYQMYAQRIQELSGLSEVDLFPSYESCMMRAARAALASKRRAVLEAAQTFVNGFTIKVVDVVPAGEIVEPVGAGVASSGCRSRGKSKVAPTGFSVAETGLSFIAKNDGF